MSSQGWQAHPAWQCVSPDGGAHAWLPLKTSLSDTFTQSYRAHKCAMAVSDFSFPSHPQLIAMPDRRCNHPLQFLLPPLLLHPSHPPLVRLQIYLLCPHHSHTGFIMAEPIHLSSSKWTKAGGKGSADDSCNRGGVE